jgi:hypothetical protein
MHKKKSIFCFAISLNDKNPEKKSPNARMKFHPGSSKNDNRQTKLVIKKLLKAFSVDR